MVHSVRRRTQRHPRKAHPVAHRLYHAGADLDICYPTFLPRDLETPTRRFLTCNSRSAILRETRHIHSPILYNRKPMRQSPPFVLAYKRIIRHKSVALRAERGSQIRTSKLLILICVRDHFEPPEGCHTHCTAQLRIPFVGCAVYILSRTVQRV